MTIKHGVYSSEVPTALQVPVESFAGLTVAVGTAPVNLAENPATNEVILAYTYDEAVKRLGYSENFNDYTLSEVLSSHFSLYAVAPIVLINVLDASTHKTDVTASTMTVNNDEVVLNEEGVLKGTIVVKSTDDSQTYVAGTDYDVVFDDKGHVHVHMHVSPAVSSVKISYSKLNPTAVTASDIIGGVANDGMQKGLELINQVFPKFRLVPGELIAPKFSTESTVAAVMAAKITNVNGLFRGDALVDIDTATAANYSTVEQVKENNSLSSPHQVVCWPKVALGGKQYHLSTHLAGVMNVTDAASDGVPNVSPSNKSLKADSAVLKDGKEIYLGLDQVNYLNGLGIVTALNFTGGWKSWGNRTAAYPSKTDVKDIFIPIRRMFNYIQNNLILSYWDKVDDPTNYKLIESVIDNENIKLNGLTAAGKLNGGRVEFLKSDNPLKNLLSGKITFRVYLGGQVPAEEIDFKVEFDKNYLESLFAS